MDVLETVVLERRNLIEEWRQKVSLAAASGGQPPLPPANAVFTALDITREAQNKHQVRDRHRNLRNDIHRIIAQYLDQDECLIDIPGVTDQPGIEKPRLYHPPEISHQVAEQIYKLKPQAGGTAQIAATATITGMPSISSGYPQITAGPSISSGTALLSPPPAAHPQGGLQSDGSYTTDKRGRLWIPANLLRKIGAGIGSFIYVTIDASASELVITGSLPGSASAAAAYKVDPNNNVALSKTVFDEAGLTSGKYEIADVGSEIRVKAK
jgi:hypothetical protein